MKIGRIFGIDIIIHVSWIFVFALVAWMLSSDVGPLHRPNMTPAVQIVIGVATSLLFFASILIHELAHSLVAKARGMRVSRIVLFIFGGVSSLEGETPGAAPEAWIAGVGPLTSFALGLIFWLISSAFGVQTPIGAASGYLAYANIVLAIFNLLPALPLDGGRVLHALIWASTNDRMRATVVAARVGRLIAGAIIAVGVLESLYVGFGQGLWLIFIGWFLLQAGGAELAQAETAAALQGVTVSDLVRPPIVEVPGDADAAAAFDRLLRFGEGSAPVVSDGRLIGDVLLSDVAKVPAADRHGTPVTAIMSGSPATEAVRTSASVDDIVRRLASGKRHYVPVVDDAGNLVGIVTWEGIMQRLSLPAER